MKLKNTFLQGKMNKDVDERLLPKGQYPHAENIRVANTDSSDVGAIENIKGNEKLTNLELNNGLVIGAAKDGSNQKLYWFITSDDKDLVVEYDVRNSITSILLQSSKPNGVLNFNKEYLITGVNKVINEDSDNDLLFWTDDLNPPRKINIERSKNYGLDGFEEEDISVIKAPPKYALKANLTYSSTGLNENNLENKFISFAYRYKYLDGELSAISSFSNYQFAPKKFKLDYHTMENEGMVNQFNAVKLDFDTGDKRVTDIELLYKESNSNTIFLIERFNKEDEDWGDGEIKSYTFTNSKRYTALPEDELFRQYDNVPRKAKAQEIIGNRLVYGNYVEGYDIKDKYGRRDINYDVSVINKDISGETLDITLNDGSSEMVVDLSGMPLSNGNMIMIDLNLSVSQGEGSYKNLFSYILDTDFDSVGELTQHESFKYFVEEVMTNSFLGNYEGEAPENSILLRNTKFTIDSSGDEMIIRTPSITYLVDDTPEDTSDNPDNTHEEEILWRFENSTEVLYKFDAIDSSLKTNRSYEVNIVYFDAQGRSTPALTTAENTVYIPQQYSDHKNQLLVNMYSLAPSWADRYKLVVKQNKGLYHTIYANIFYEEGLFRWIKIDGANKDKVREGDTLIVKADSSGILNDVIKTRVLEKVHKDEDFLPDNEDLEGNEIKELSGTYIKVKPNGWDLSTDGDSFIEERDYRASSNNPYNYLDVGKFNNIIGGSRIRIHIASWEKHATDNRWEYESQIVASEDYPNFRAFYDAQMAGNSEWEDFLDDHITILWGSNDELLRIRSREGGYGWGGRRRLESIITYQGSSLVIFETEPEESDIDIYYETEQTFDIIDGLHQGNIGNQTLLGQPATIEMDFFNCYVQGNGAESYRYKDAFSVGTNNEGNTVTANYLNIDLRPTSTTISEYKETRRYADLTYSESYNENNNLNGLNEFNLAKANYKEDIDKSYGYIQKLHSRDSDLIVFQEDKVSKILYGKDLLMNADGTHNVSTIDDVLGGQVPFTGEYGISRNPESFAYDGRYIYFTDAKRGSVMRLASNGLEEISNLGMRQYFKSVFKQGIDNKKLAAVDPYNDQYVLYPSSQNKTEVINTECTKGVTKTNFNGELIINIDYGVLIGEVGFFYETNGKPIRFDITWGDESYTTGFVGDSEYDDFVMPEQEGRWGEFRFNKTSSYPTKATIKVTAPLCDSSFTLKSICIPAKTLTVVNVIVNDERDNGLTIRNKYRWSTDNYISPPKTHEVSFTEELINSFNFTSGNEGDVNMPINGSTVIMESFKGIGHTGTFLNGNRLGYLVSNTEYTEEEISDLLSEATFLEVNENTFASGDINNSASFQFNRDSEKYLYLIWDYRDTELVINQNTKIKIYFDSSGSMNTALFPLRTMRDTILKDRLLPLYNNDSDAYDRNVEVILVSDERTIQMLNMQGEMPSGNVITMIFQDESSPYGVGYGVGDICPPRPEYNTDIEIFRNRLINFPENYYRGVVFQVEGNVPPFKSFLQAVQNGTDCYQGINGLSDRTEINYKYDILKSGTPEYYLNQIVNALIELGYEL